MSSFKVKLRVPPSHGRLEDSPGPSTPDISITEGGDSEIDYGDSGAEEQDGADEADTADADPATSEVDELDETKYDSTTKKKRSGVVPNSTAAMAATLSIEEIDALPSAKRRKSLKTRGAPGPGRGWRKGLSKGQKPVYTLPGDISTAEIQHSPELEAQPSTPKSFAKPGSAPPQKSKPKSSAFSRSSASEFASASMPVAANSPDAAFKYPTMPGPKYNPTLHALPRIPNYIPNVTPLDRNDKRKPRHWIHDKREILNIAGRTWRAPAWIGGKDRDYKPAPKEAS
ncbi:hypothetical protein MCUN1_003853 [Malassezia cuniculi]|uniref:Uncharacterized protein n=1 Tax=Malassezia cuniculi TaxID=948313 RepID=A0AAF0JDI3_9BASI|nr:hypothetical protein MCUN1_003853 [Malassezia cuniculi]